MVNRPYGIRELKTRVKACGSHYFDRSTMRFFRSRVVGKPRIASDDKVYFLTQEARGFGGEGGRAYTVRVFDPRDCDVTTLGEFLGHDTPQGAAAALKKILGSGREPKTFFQGR